MSALEKSAYDPVLMDVQMPEMDGLEATKLLREKESVSGHRQAIVAMTALVMKGDRERCMAAGIDDYLSKPIRPQELDETLDGYLARFREETPGAEADNVPDASVCKEELIERINGDLRRVAHALQGALGNLAAPNASRTNRSQLNCF